MPKARAPRSDVRTEGYRAGPQTVPREYAGRWIVWSSDGLRIIAVGDSFEECEQAAIRAGFSADQVAIERVPESRYRPTGSST